MKPRHQKIRRAAPEEARMEGQRERTSSRRRQRRKSKNARGKVPLEPVLIAARRPDSPLLRNGFRNVIASAEPKRSGLASVQLTDAFGSPAASSRALSLDDGAHPGQNGTSEHGPASFDDAAEGNRPTGSGAFDASPAPVLDAIDRADAPRPDGVRRRAVRIVKVAEQALAPDNREQRLLDRLVRSQGRSAISRAADDLWDSKFVAPRQQEVQIQLLEHENEHRARDAVFVMAELLQRESPIQRPVLDQRLRRLEEFAEDPITRDAARALRRSMRVHHGA
jgi:hypothetical protein